jgi:hypothetical protein
VAGQAESLQVSVGAADQILEWLDQSDIINPPNSAVQAKSNIYVCQFNPKRVRIDPQGQVVAYPTTTRRSTLTANDRLAAVRRPTSQFNNYLATGTARDWLNFAGYIYYIIYLRGQGKSAHNFWARRRLAAEPGSQKLSQQSGSKKLLRPQHCLCCSTL